MGHLVVIAMKEKCGSDSNGAAKLLLSAKEAAALCGISVRQWWRWNAVGRVPEPVRIGATKRWRSIDLERWIAAGCPARLQLTRD